MKNSLMTEQKNRILVIVAHPDDETIGMGGTISKLLRDGDRVDVISMTDGVSSRTKSSSCEIEERAKSAKLASEILGFSWFKQLNFPDNAMDTVALIDIIKEIELAKQELCPDIIYTHSAADLNVDHRITLEATLTAFRPQPAEKYAEIISFEVQSSSEYGHKSIFGEFSPNMFVNISDFWETKESALCAYEKEMRLYPHSRSIEGLSFLSNHRGSQVGLERAEAFEILRKVIRK